MYVDAFPSGIGRAEAGVRSQLSFMICCTLTWVIIHTNTPQLHTYRWLSGCSYPHRC